MIRKATYDYYLLMVLVVFNAALIVITGCEPAGKQPEKTSGNADVEMPASLDVSLLADTTVSYTAYDLYLHQELINDAPGGRTATGRQHWIIMVRFIYLNKRLL